MCLDQGPQHSDADEARTSVDKHRVGSIGFREWCFTDFDTQFLCMVRTCVFTDEFLGLCLNSTFHRKGALIPELRHIQ